MNHAHAHITRWTEAMLCAVLCMLACVACIQYTVCVYIPYVYNACSVVDVVALL